MLNLRVFILDRRFVDWWVVGSFCCGIPALSSPLPSPSTSCSTPIQIQVSEHVLILTLYNKKNMFFFVFFNIVNHLV